MGSLSGMVDNYENSTSKVLNLLSGSLSNEATYK